MTTPHRCKHEGWLQAALLGEMEPAGPRLAELQACPSCGPALKDLSALQQGLEAAAAEEREVLSRAGREAGPKEQDLVRAFVEARLREERAPSPLARVHGRWLVPLAAAAALLACAWLVRELIPAPRSPREPEMTLGSSQGIALHAPVRDGRGDVTFAWEAPAAPGQKFTLSVWSDEGGPAAPLAERHDLKLPRCTFARELVEAWPTRIRWEVRALQPGGGAGGYARASGSRP